MIVQEYINHVARQANNAFIGSYNDFEDLVQIGLIAEWRARKKHDSDRYIYSAIKHEIDNAAIDSYYILSASHRTNLMAMKIQNLLRNGFSKEQIMKKLSISSSKFVSLNQMAARIERYLE